MVSNPESLTQSRDKTSPAQPSYQTPEFSNHSFAPENRQACPTDTEKDLSDVASRSPHEQLSEELRLATPKPSQAQIEEQRKASAELLEKIGLPSLEFFDDSISADIALLAKDLGTESTLKTTKPESITYPGDKKRHLGWDGDVLSSMTGPDGKKWDRVQESGKYQEAWRDSTGAIWKGTMEFDTSTNDFTLIPSGWPKSGGTKTITHSGGEKESVRADGSRSIDYLNNDQVAFNKDNQMISFRSADGITRKFSDFKTLDGSDETVPAKIEVVTPATTQAPSTVFNWKLTGNKEWTIDGVPAERSVFHVDSKHGTYGVDNLMTGINRRWVPGKFVEHSEWEGAEVHRIRDNVDGSKTISSLDQKWSVDISNDLSTRYEADGKVRKIERDDKGAVTSLRDTSSNREWVKDDKSQWTAKPIDQSKPYTPPAVPSFSGELLVDAHGLTLVKGTDETFKVLDMNGVLSAPSKSEVLRGLAATSSIHRPGQARFAESVNNFMERSDISGEQKDKAIEHITRLMKSSEGGPFSSANKQALAGQLSWHLARPNRQEQGQNSTCNVTTIRSSMIKESPAEFAKMIADVGTTGQFITADGSTITPRADGLNLHKADEKFPPAPGERTWLGQVSDQTMANIYWQRMTVDTFGQQVNKGELNYVQRVGSGDSGERVERWQQDRMLYQLRRKSDQYLATSPELGVGVLSDIYEQLTGKDQSERVVAANLVPTVIGEKEKGVKVNSEKEFEAEMNKGPWPKIIAVHTSRDPFYTDSGQGSAGGAGGRDGGWHVVVAQSYDSNARKVSVDNSWSPSVDHIIPSQRINVKQLYEATLGPSK